MTLPELIDAIRGRQSDYALTFNSPSGKAVLADLEKAAFDRVSEFDPNPHVHARNSGMRALLMHIRQQLDTPFGELVETYSRQYKISPTVMETEE